MTVNKIEARKRLEALVHDTAIEIRKLLDARRDEYDAVAEQADASSWDEDDVESNIMGLVTEE